MWESVSRCQGSVALGALECSDFDRTANEVIAEGGVCPLGTGYGLAVQDQLASGETLGLCEVCEGCAFCNLYGAEAGAGENDERDEHVVFFLRCCS